MKYKHNFQTIPNQLKIQHLYNKLDIEQLIRLSKVNKEFKKTLEPIIRKKLKKIYKRDLQNYNLLFNNFDSPKDPYLLEKIYNSYDNKSLFIRFLLKYMNIRAKSISKKKEFLFALQIRFHNSLIVQNILEKLYKNIYFYID